MYSVLVFYIRNLVCGICTAPSGNQGVSDLARANIESKIELEILSRVQVGGERWKRFASGVMRKRTDDESADEREGARGH